MEAALEASGLLDAWVSPYNGITLPGHDTRAEAALAVTAPGPSLLEVLRPEEGIPVPVDTVTRLLAGVAFGAGPARRSLRGRVRRRRLASRPRHRVLEQAGTGPHRRARPAAGPAARDRPN